MKNRTDVYTAITQFGIVEVDFPEDGGVVFSGPGSAVDHLKAVISETIGSDGITLSPESVEPNDFLNFCQPEGSGITIIEPIDDMISPDSGDAAIPNGDGISMDSASEVSRDVISMRLAIRSASGVMEKLAVMASIIEFFKAKQNQDAGQDQSEKKEQEENVTETTEAVKAAQEGQEPPATDSESTATIEQIKAFYPSGEERLTPSRRQKANDAATALLRQIEARGDGKASDAEKAILAQYTGSGGNLVSHNGRKGSPYEYYTPKPIAEAAWSIMAELGFTGGKVLDPCAGSGIFGATRPEGVTVDAVELSDVSGGINNLVNGNCTVAPFEEVASRTPEESYDAILTNVPFGDSTMRGANAGKDPLYQNEDLEGYFLMRTMRKLKSGGIAAYICPPRVVSGMGNKESNVRYQLSLMGEFIGAFRLPNSVFQLATEADTITDLVVFRKHTKEQKAQIDACQSGGFADLLRASGVLWDQFLEGQYFKGEGLRFQLGEFVAKDPAKFRDVDRVVAADGGKPADVAKLITKLGSGRISWPALDSVVALPAETNDGDAIYDGGALKIMQDGQIVLKDGVADVYKAEQLAKMETALDAVLNDVSHLQAKELLALAGDKAPAWLRMVEYAIGSTNDSAAYAGKVSPHWPVMIAALAAGELIKRHGNEFDYLTSYPKVSAYLKAHGKRAIEARDVVTGMPRLVNALEMVPSLFAGKSFMPLWTGEKVNEAVVDRSPGQRFDALRYEKGDERGAVPAEDWKEIFGIDPLESDSWCVTGDGKVISANDYYVGTYGELMASIRLDLDAATDEKTRAKIASQMNRAAALVNMPNYDALNYDLQTPFVSAQIKLQYLQENIHRMFELETSGAGKLRFQYKGKAGIEDVRKWKRFAVWLNDGTVSAGMTNEAINEDPEEYKQLIAAIKDMISKGNAGFNVWMKSSGKTTQLKADFDISKAGFVGVEEDDSQVIIDGMNMNLGGEDIQFRGYQNQAIRQYTRNLSGICALDVGLGKTLTALATVKHMHNVGAKKRTIIAVPKAVLANWQREATSLYKDSDDCLFVGYRDGETNSKYFNEDLAKIPGGQYAKIFMSVDTLVSIPLKEKTVADYLDFMQVADKSYLSIEDDGKDATRIAGEARIAKEIKSMTDGRSSVPYFEDMGIDSLVIDEAHVMKNGKVARGLGSVKFMSLPEKSLRAMNGGIKAWFIRNGTTKGDGVLLLTATPITNSPLEIYSMMALAAGDMKINSALGGMESAEDFISAYATISSRNEGTITGDVTSKEVSVFDGLKNVNDLRRVLSGVALIKTAAESGLPLPETIETAVSVGVDPLLKSAIDNDKKVFKEAMKALMDGDKDRNTIMLASPFNLIDKMSKGILDRDMYDNVSRFVIKDAKMADASVAKFNELALVDKKRSHNSYLTENENVVTTYDLKASESDDGKKSKKAAIVPYQGDIGGYEFDVKVISVRPDQEKEIVAALDTVNPVMQGRMVKIVGEENIDVTVSPKIAAMIENVKKELASPVSGSGGMAKQIIFCDMLGMHAKIRLALVTKAGVPAGKIAIISGAVTPEPEDVQDVSDGFNGMEEDNRFTVVIANKKAEVGINLQKGTQAVHHLTTGWTPDSIHQRNGRAIRQGNKAERVTVYHYDADGTFDSYKRNLLSKKADWIDSVLTDTGEDDVSIGGSLSKKDIEKMTEMFGDPEAIRRFNDERAQREKEQVSADARQKQISLMNVVKIPQGFLSKYSTADAYARQKVRADYESLSGEAGALTAELSRFNESLDKIKDQKSETAIKNQARLNSRIESVTALIAKKEAAADALLTKINELDTKGEDSELYKEWSEAKARNQSILDQTKAEFAKVKNGYAASAIDQFMEGKGQVINGEYIAQGMIGTHENGDLFVTGKPSQNIVAISHSNPYGTPVSSISGASYSHDGSPDWELKLKAVADADADAVKAGGKLLLTKSIPASVKYLPEDMPIFASFYDKKVMLKAPAYRIPMEYLPRMAGAFTNAAFESQKGVILSNDGREFSVGRDSVKILEDAYSFHDEAQAAIDFSRQTKIKATRDEIPVNYVVHALTGLYENQIIEQLSKKAFASEDEVDAFVADYTDKVGEVVQDYVIYRIGNDILAAKKRVQLARYGDNVMVIDQLFRFSGTAPCVALLADLQTNSPYYVSDSGGYNEDAAISAMSCKIITYENDRSFLCQSAGVTYIVAAYMVEAFVKSDHKFLLAVAVAGEAKLPPEVKDMIASIKTAAGVGQVGVIKESVTASHKGGKTVVYPAYSAIYVETKFGGAASKRLMGNGLHFEKGGNFPPAWLVSIQPETGKKTVDDLMMMLGV